MHGAKKRGYLWVTLALFGVSLSGHWLLAWLHYVEVVSRARAPVRFRSTLQ